MKALSAALLLFVVVLTGCTTTRPEGPDPMKLAKARLLIEPVAAGAVRRVIQNSPEHAPKLAKYAASVADIFCLMANSNQFAPEFLIDALGNFTDPELAQVGDGYLLDVKNLGVGIYKLLWLDRGRAEIPPDQWMDAVCDLFCASIRRGLADAGYPGGYPTTLEK